MQTFVDEHRALILRIARAHVRTLVDRIAAEDVAREVALELAQLGDRGLTPGAIASPHAYLQTIVKHAAGRAKRRRTLIEQLAAGDDLGALSADLDALDADLPSMPAPPSADAAAARATLDAVKSALAPRDALIFALLIEDGADVEEAALALGTHEGEIEAARTRALAVAASQGVAVDVDTAQRPRAEERA